MKTRILALCTSGPLLLACTLLMGCAGAGALGKSPEEDEEWRSVRRAGSWPVSTNSLEQVNLIELMDPLGVESHNHRGRSISARYDMLMARFESLDPSVSVASRRNLVQNRLMAASDRRCGRFYQFLKTDNSDTNFQFALGASALSVLGALVPGAQAARNLSGASALVSGWRAEYNNEYYSNMAVSVITRAIEERRGMLREQLAQAQLRPYTTYDVATAVADAVRYDASCNIVVGLEQANEALARLQDPGRDAINKALAKNMVARAISIGDDKALAQAQKIQADVSAPNTPDGPSSSGLGNSGDSAKAAAADGDFRSPAVAVEANVQAIERTRAAFVASLGRMAVLIADATDDTNDGVMKKMQDSLAASAAGAEKSWSNRYVSPGKCHAEARAVALGVANALAEWQLADKGERADRQDALHDRQRGVTIFLEKIDRHLQATEQTLSAAESALNRGLAGKKPSQTDIDKVQKAVEDELKEAALNRRVGTARGCGAMAS